MSSLWRLSKIASEQSLRVQIPWVRSLSINSVFFRWRLFSSAIAINLLISFRFTFYSRWWKKTRSCNLESTTILKNFKKFSSIFELTTPFGANSSTLIARKISFRHCFILSCRKGRLSISLRKALQKDLISLLCTEKITRPFIIFIRHCSTSRPKH